jgi:hypothetical protein
MLMGLLAILILAAVPLTRGDLRRLADVRLGWAWLLPVALGLQVLVITVDPRLPRVLTVGTHLLTYGLAGAFLWRNRRVPGIVVLALGAASNAITIGLNGGTLPASAAAVRAAGLEIDPTVFTNSGVLAHPRLAWLGDVFAVPSWVPFANVFSVGDVLILVGAGVLVHRTCRRRPASAGVSVGVCA